MNRLGGENQQTSLNHSKGYSIKAQLTGNPAYLEPNSDSMQKPIEGPSIGYRFNQKHAEKNRKQTAQQENSAPSPL
jgi:hypothetical protein